MKADDRSYHRRQLDSAVDEAERLEEKIKLAIDELKMDDEAGTEEARAALTSSLEDLRRVANELGRARRYVSRRPEAVS